jgi:hypothetical protein
MRCSWLPIGKTSQRRCCGSVLNAMPVRNQILLTDSVADDPKPIEYQTENGFRIVRVCEINRSIPAVGLMHRFLVRDPDGFELEITVEIIEAVATALVGRSRGSLSADSSYWVCCAERHLGTYLLEVMDYPPDEKLIVDQPSSDDLNSAMRWETEIGNSEEVKVEGFVFEQPAV